MYLTNKCRRISDDKIKEGVFSGPHVRELTQRVKLKTS
jgi:bacterioferritin-associated ferredoxin